MRHLRTIRAYLIGAVLGAVLMLGGQALADIPDAHPSSPDPAHTFYVCVGRNPQPYKALYALDKSQGNCPATTDQHELVPAVPAP
jgi:hypothetical protein